MKRPRIVKVGEKEVAIFAPLRPKSSALKPSLPGRWLLSRHRAALDNRVAGVPPGDADSCDRCDHVMYSLSLILTISMAARSFRDSPEEHISDDIVHALNNAEWPMYTVLCPLYRGSASGATVRQRLCKH